MYLHLGEETIVHNRSIIGIFDLDNTTVGETGREFLAKAQKEGLVRNISDNLPKSFVICTEPEENEGMPVRKSRIRKRVRNERCVVYISQLASATLRRRAEQNSME